MKLAELSFVRIETIKLNCNLDLSIYLRKHIFL